MTRVTSRRIVVLGPTSLPLAALDDEVRADLDRLTRPGVELTYRVTGGGPAHVRSPDDAAAAAPHVVRAVRDAATDGFDAVVVDCTGDPGVADAGRAVGIPVVGAGAALRAAIDAAPPPVEIVTGDQLRADATWSPGGATATVAIAATGWSSMAATWRAARPGLVVLDPLDVALAACLAALDAARG